MTELHPEHALLIAVADGCAGADDIERAQELITADPDAAEFFYNLQLTTLAYDDDYSEQPEVPQSLLDQIRLAEPPIEPPVEQYGETLNESSSGLESIVEAQPLDGSSTVTTDGNVTVLQTSEVAVTPKKFGVVALAASVFLGLVSGALIYGTATSQRNGLHTGSEFARAEVPEWVRLVADYHRLYSRETLTGTLPSSAELVSKQVSEKLNSNVTVPVLEKHGMEFKRAQWLSIDEQPLLQLAYLPDTGEPLAVCVLRKTDSHDMPVEYGETGGMQYAHWQNDNLAVVVVGTVDSQQLAEISSIVESELL